MWRKDFGAKVSTATHCELESTVLPPYSLVSDMSEANEVDVDVSSKIYDDRCKIVESRKLWDERSSRLDWADVGVKLTDIFS
jgi:hypothetical protein